MIIVSYIFCTICLKFWLGNSVELRNTSELSVLTFVGKTPGQAGFPSSCRRKRFKMLVRIRECFFTVSLYPSSLTYLFFTYWWLVFIQFSTTYSTFINVYFCANLNNLFHAYCISMAKFDLSDLNDLYRWSLKSIFKRADYILLLIIIYLCGFFYNLIL